MIALDDVKVTDKDIEDARVILRSAMCIKIMIYKISEVYSVYKWQLIKSHHSL